MVGCLATPPSKRLQERRGPTNGRVCDDPSTIADRESSQPNTTPRVSIVVPSRNRHRLLYECVLGIATGTRSQPVEVIVVDDGSQPPLTAESLPADVDVLVLRLEGEGPAAARNAGARVARGDIVLFTDDDVVPSLGWAAAAVDYMDGHLSSVAVTGSIRSAVWDPLYEQSVEAAEPGHQWTCNIAYRRDVFARLGGFRADVFTNAHAEDRDLAIRALETGEIGFSGDMEVRHTPRRIGLRDVARQARWARDDLVLYALHPELTNDFALPVKLALVVGAGRPWLRHAFMPSSATSLKRLPRAFTLTLIATTATAWAVLRTPPASVLRSRHAAGSTAATAIGSAPKP